MRNEFLSYNSSCYPFFNAFNRKLNVKIIYLFNMLYTDIAFVSESLCKLLCELNLTHHASRASLSLKETEAASARGVSFW